MQTAFNVGFCAKSAADTHIRHMAGAQKGRGERRHAGPCKVLVVDDESDLADLTALLLGSHGFTPSIAYSAAEALRILEADRGIEALFSDIMMPGMTGLELASVVRKLYPEVKIVLASGYTSPTLLAASDHRDDGDRPYLFTAKPYRIETVMALLRGTVTPGI